MKITITGSLGNISKPLAQQLIAAGHQVTIISSNPERIASIRAMGATPAIGSIADKAFLTSAFAGADAVYTMVPPDFSVANVRLYFAEIGQNYADAIRQAGVRLVVNLSSMGAHLDTPPKPIAGAQDVENALNSLENVAVKHLRAPFFYVNFYNNMDMIRHMGVLGSNYPGNTRLIMVHPDEIASAAAEAIQKGFSGKSIRYVVSDERTTGEIATVLGKAIGKPELPWVEFSDAQAFQGMLQGGMPALMAEVFVEAGTFVRSGQLWEDYDDRKDLPSGHRKLENFASEFAKKFKNQ